MSKRLIPIFIAFIAFSPSSGAADEFNSSLTGSVDALANVSSDPQNRQDADVENNQPASVVASDVTGLAQASALDSLSTSGGQIAFTFTGSARTSGAAGAFPAASSSFQYTFVTSAPMYYDFTFHTEAANGATSQIYLSGLPTGLLRFGQNGEPEEDGSFQGMLPAGSYALGASVSIYNQLSEAGFESGSFMGDFDVIVPEPEIAPV